MSVRLVRTYLNIGIETLSGVVPANAGTQHVEILGNSWTTHLCC